MAKYVVLFKKSGIFFKPYLNSLLFTSDSSIEDKYHVRKIVSNIKDVS